jgi:hypothetical protein
MIYDSDEDGFDGEIPENLRPWFESQKKWQSKSPRIEHFILVNGKIKPATMMEWIKWFENPQNRIIDYTEISDEVYVSTIFLGIDHNFRFIDLALGNEQHRPLLFETMVFGGKFTNKSWRYSTYGESKRGHWAIVNQLKNNLPPSVEYGERPFFEDFLDMMSDIFKEEDDQQSEDQPK